MLIGYEVFLSRQQKPDTIRDSVVKDYIKGFPLKYISNKYQVSKGLYYKDIAKRLGVSVGTIGRVINKKSYRDENIDRKR